MEWIVTLLISAILCFTTIQGETLSVCPNYDEGKQSRITAGQESGYIVSHPDYNGLTTYGANQHCELSLKDTAIGETYILVEEMRIEPVESCDRQVESMNIPIIGRGCLIDQSGGNYTYAINSFIDHDYFDRPTDLKFRFDTNKNTNAEDYGFKVWYGTNVQTICTAGEPTNTTVSAGSSGRLRSHIQLSDATFTSPFPCTYNIQDIPTDSTVLITLKYLDICTEGISQSNYNYLKIGVRTVVCPNDEFLEPFLVQPDTEGKITITHYSPEAARGFLLEYEVLENMDEYDSAQSGELEVFSDVFLSTRITEDVSTLKPSLSLVHKQSTEIKKSTQRTNKENNETVPLMEDQNFLKILITCIVVSVILTVIILVGTLLWKRRQNNRNDDLKSDLPTNYDRNSVYYTDITGINRSVSLNQTVKPVTNPSYEQRADRISSSLDGVSNTKAHTFERKPSEEDMRYIHPDTGEHSEVKLYRNNLYQPSGDDNSFRLNIDNACQ